MRFIDMHCDTFWLLMQNQDAGLKENEYCVDLQKMKKSGCMAEFFANFIYMDQFSGEHAWDEGYQHALEMIENGKRSISDCEGTISIAHSYDDIILNAQNDKISAILTLEEGGVIHGKMDRIDELFQQGTRLITLTWNYENCMGYPNSRDCDTMKKGLKPFGLDAVEYMNEKGMLVDVSHLSDGGFWDVVSHSKKPFVASHSNARELCDHPRNLSDEMIKALAERGGVCGLNFYPYFLKHDGIASSRDIAEHAWHIYQVGGEDVLAIGTDFDGFDEGQLDVVHIGEMNIVCEALKRRGFTDRQLDKIGYNNILRVIKEQ